MTAVLTQKEDLICRYKCLGLQRKEIAAQMKRSENTLLVHNRNIHSKLHVNNDVEIVIWYIENVLHIEIKKLIQVLVLLALLIPTMLLDSGSMVRVQRSGRSSGTARTRRADEGCNANYLLEL